MSSAAYPRVKDALEPSFVLSSVSHSFEASDEVAIGSRDYQKIIRISIGIGDFSLVFTPFR